MVQKWYSIVSQLSTIQFGGCTVAKKKEKASRKQYAGLAHVQVFVPKEAYAEMKKAAVSDDRSVSSWVRVTLSAALAKKRA
jgi:hypothetical protein